MTSRGIDRLIDLITSQSQRSTTIPIQTSEMVVIDATEEMSILPDTPDGPMLQIEKRSPQGQVLSRVKMNLSAVDNLIGRLITMRDHLAAIKRGQ